MSSTRDISLAFAQCKASHNSEERNETLAEQLTWDPKQPWQAGCRCLELDVAQSSTAWKWSVNHSSTYDPKPDKQLPVWLDQVKVWMDENPESEPIIVYLDLKNAPMDNAEFARQIDALAASVFGARIYAPDALMGGAPDLVAGAQKNGFPSLGALKGRVILAFTGSDSGAVGARRAYYADNDPSKRLFFVDRDCGTGTGPYPSTTSGTRVLLNLHIYTDMTSWQTFGAAFSKEPGFLTRGWVANGEKLWNQALNDGLLNMIATDKIKNYPWAMVGETPYRAMPFASGG